MGAQVRRGFAVISVTSAPPRNARRGEAHCVARLPAFCRALLNSNELLSPLTRCTRAAISQSDGARTGRARTDVDVGRRADGAESDLVNCRTSHRRLAAFSRSSARGVSHLELVGLQAGAGEARRPALPAGELVSFQGKNGPLMRSPWGFSPARERRFISDMLPALGAHADDMAFLHGMTSRTTALVRGAFS